MHTFARQIEPDRADSRRRILAYCHDSVGIGHLRRTMAICERVGETYRDCSFLLATGTPYHTLFNDHAKIDCIKLPALKKNPGGAYASKYLAISLEQMMRCRESILLETVKSYEPHILLVDKAPLGVCNELLPTLRWLRKNRPNVRIVFGMRDIEDAAPATIECWSRNAVQKMLEECYHEVWVYGMRSLFDVAAEYRLSDAIQKKMRYMGYVARRPCEHIAPPHDAKRSVLVTVGGGTDGERLLSWYLSDAAARVADAGLRSVLVGGPDLPRNAATELRRRAARLPGTSWVDFDPCMSCRMKQAELVVTMGGYNTLCELAAQRKAALVIPRTEPRLEQKIRADIWEQLGVLRTLPERSFSASGVADHVMDMVGSTPQPNGASLDLSGLDHVADRFATLFDREASRAAAIRL